MSLDAQRPNGPGKRNVEHAPGFVLPADREVDCACDPKLERPVFRDPTGWNNRVTACMSCGKVSLTESLVEEPQPHDVRCVGNRIEAVGADVLAWLSAWPRLAWGVWQQDRAIYLPAGLRCGTAAELEVQERHFLAEQKNLTAAERLRSVGVPMGAPPAGLPQHLRTFVQTQAGLRLGDQTDLETLLSHCDRTDWAMPFAYEILKKRTDLVAVVVEMLKSGDESRRRIGIWLVQYGRLKDAEIVTTVIGLLEKSKTDPEGQGWLGILLDTLYYLGSAAAGARPILRAMAEKIGNSDYYLRKRLEQTRELLK